MNSKVLCQKRNLPYRTHGRIMVMVGFGFVIAFLLFGFWRVSQVFSQSSSPVVINEIMYNPTFDDNYNEWVEIKNTSPEPVNLSGWTLCEKLLLPGYISRSGGVEDDRGLVLAPGAFALLTDGGSGTDVYTNFSVASAALSIHIDSSSLCGGPLSNTAGSEKELVLANNAFSDSVKYQISWGGSGNGKSVARDGHGEWEEANPTPGSENDFVVVPPPPNQPQPSLVFSFPPRVFAGQEFSVSVELTNFESETYALKVLIGKGGSFIYGNTKGSSGWLTQNGVWKEMPQVSIGSSGTASLTIQAMVDEDAQAGGYEVTASVSKKNGDSYTALWPIGELPKKPLQVSAPSQSAGRSSHLSSQGEGGSDSPEFALEETGAAPSGEVLGEVNQEGKKKFALNFYLVTGIFGLLVGGAGLFFGFRYLP